MGDALRERRTAGVVEPLGAGGPIGAAAQRGVVVVQPVQVVAGDVGRRLGIAVLQKQGQQVERERQMVGRGLLTTAARIFSVPLFHPLQALCFVPGSILLIRILS